MISHFSRRSRMLLSGCAAIAAILPAAAYAGDVVGTVSDGSNTRALQGAEVRILELDRVVQADRDGSFRFPHVPAGTYTLEARYLGADKRSQSIIVPESGSVSANMVLGDDGAILVVGQAANLSSSLSRQRAADGVESVLTRDAIGQFPDQNVAESMRRLPGVNILADQGEGRFVSVRGLDPELNAASINGTRIPAPGGDTRSVALDVVAAELIESIEVKKTLTPDMDADTLGASIEINTTSAFDRKKDLLSIKLEGSYNDYADSLTPKASLDFSTRITDNFGIAGGISYYRRKFESDNIEGADWKTADDGTVYAEELQYRDYDVERERLGATLSLDFRASDSTKLYARGLYSQFSDQEYRGDVIMIMDGEPFAGSTTSAEFSTADDRIEVRRRMKDRYEKQKIKSLTLGGETDSDAWKLKYSLSYAESTEAENGSVDPTRFRARFNGDGDDEIRIKFDYADIRRPSFSVSGNSALFNDPSQYKFNELESTDMELSRDKEWTAKFDAAREFALDHGTFTVQGGVKSRWRKKSYDFETTVYKGFNGSYTLADVLGGQTYRIQDLGPLPQQGGTSDFFYDNRDKFILNPFDTLVNSASTDYAIDEDILAGYLLGRYDSGALRVIGGVRVEHTKNDISGNIINAEDEDNVIVTPTHFKRSYTDFLPSLAVRYEVSDDVLLRFGASKSLVRPKLSSLAPRFIIDEDREAEFGNPDLKPYSAWNLDLSAEWYFAKNSSLSAGIFWKSVKDFIVEVKNDETGSAYGVSFDRSTTWQNGDTAKIKGLELSFAHQFTNLPAPFDGLLLNANYSYTDAVGTVYTDGDISKPRDISLPSSSKHTFNVALGYEKGPLSLRAAGTYRDKYLDELGASAEEDRIVDQHFQLDLSAKYRVTDKVRLFAEWVNVTDAPYFAYQQYAGAKRLLQYEKYSWTAKFGVSANF